MYIYYYLYFTDRDKTMMDVVHLIIRVLLTKLEIFTRSYRLACENS